MVTVGVAIVVLAVLGLLVLLLVYAIGLALPPLWRLARQVLSLKRLAVSAGVAVALVTAVWLTVGGCSAEPCGAPCKYGALTELGFCAAPTSEGRCACADLCPGFCLLDAGFENGYVGTPSAVPCPGFCSNAAQTKATPCDGG